MIKEKLIAVDCSKLAPALYIADKYYLVPRINESNYIKVIKDICVNEKISAILSLIDPELSLLAKHVDDFNEIGTKVIVSPYEACELCLDKYAMFKFSKNNGYKYAKTYNSYNDF